MSVGAKSSGTGWVVALVVVLVGALLVVPISIALLAALITDSDGQGDSCQAVVSQQPGETGQEIPNGWGPLVDDAAKVAGLPTAVLAAQIAKESSWNPDAINGKHVGLGQFSPETWAMYGEGDPRDPAAAIRAMGRYMKALMDLAGEHTDDATEQTRMALAAYNWGDGNMASVGWDWTKGPAETTAYVPAILDGAQLGYSPECAPVAGQYAGDLGDGEWTSPLPEGVMTGAGGFGARNVPGLPSWAQNHVGIDLATRPAAYDPGGSVVAPVDLRVTGIYEPDGCVLAKATTGPEFGFGFCHLERWGVKVGDELERGDIVGVEGNRATSVGSLVISHLHFEMYRPEGGDPTSPANGDVIDPTPILRAKGAL